MHSAVGLFCISMKTTFDQQLELSPSATCDLSHPWVPGSGGDSPSWERTRGQSRPLSTHRGTGAGPCILQWSSRGRLIHGTSLEHLAGEREGTLPVATLSVSACYRTQTQRSISFSCIGGTARSHSISCSCAQTLLIC